MGTSEPLPAFKFSIYDQKPRELKCGSAREASVEEFPVSKNLAGVYMSLQPGGLRELHWHANAAEWAYMITGRARVTVFAPDGSWETADFGPGDVWYFPRGHGHSIQGIGSEECTFILVFDNGAFSEFATFSLSDWLAHTPNEILMRNLRLGAEEIAKLPKSEVYIADGVVPAESIADPGIAQTSPEKHKYRLGSQEPREFDGGHMRIVSQVEFPISSTMTGALLDLKPGAFREMHWHPNADEWQFYTNGKARMTVFASSGRASTVDFKVGDVGYVPMGYGHYIENIGEENLQVVIVLNNGDYQEISVTGWLSSQPSNVLEANLNLSQSALDKLPKASIFIGE